MYDKVKNKIKKMIDLILIKSFNKKTMKEFFLTVTFQKTLHITGTVYLTVLSYKLKLNKAH